MKDIKDRLDDHEDRIKNLESHTAMQARTVAMLTTLVEDLKEMFNAYLKDNKDMHIQMHSREDLFIQQIHGIKNEIQKYFAEIGQRLDELEAGSGTQIPRKNADKNEK